MYGASVPLVNTFCVSPNNCRPDNAVRCFHCEESSTDPSPWQVEFDGQQRNLCCAGCQAVMQAIVDAQLGDYYRFRTEPAHFGLVPADLQSQLDDFAVYDEPEVQEKLTHRIAVR